MFDGNPNASILQVYDHVMYLRHVCINSNAGQILGAMFFAWSFVIAALLYAYWVYAAFHLMSLQGEEIADWELAQLHWSRRRRLLGRQIARAERMHPRWFIAS